MNLGAYIKGDSFDAVLHGAAPIVAFGHARQDGQRRALAYRCTDTEEVIILGIGSGFTLKQLLGKMDNKSRRRGVQYLARRAAVPPITVAELQVRINELLAGGRSDRSEESSSAD